MTKLISTVRVGSVELKNPIMTASGTAGYGAELNEYMPLAQLGGVVIKSLASFEWPGNPAPRLHPTALGMLNSVGLQGPGIESWINKQLPALVETGATIVASIWGRNVDDYSRAAEQLAPVAKYLSALEVNLSCPNVSSGAHVSGVQVMFAHDEELTAQVMRSTAACPVPRWAKLSPNTDRLVRIAGVAHESGAAAVTLVNTALGMVINTRTGLPALGKGTGGGLSGRGIHPIAVRSVYDVAAAYPQLAIVGVGGVASGTDAAELMLAGASAVQVGTASFADPRAPWRIAKELVRWANSEGITQWSQVTGAAHRGGLKGIVR